MLYLRSWLHPRGTKVPIHHFKGKSTLNTMHNVVMLLTCASTVYTPIFRAGVREKVFNAKCIGFIKVVLKAICYA